MINDIVEYINSKQASLDSSELVKNRRRKLLFVSPSTLPAMPLLVAAGTRVSFITFNCLLGVCP